jgi:hypothetical protein
MIENEQAIQASLMEVINALARNHIDLRRADLILKALWIAVKNARRARFGVDDNKMVREVPEYAAAPKLAVRPEPAPAAELNETEQYIAKCQVENTIAQLQSRTLGDIPAPAVANAAPPAPVLVPTLSAQPEILAKPETAPSKVAQLDPTQRKPAARAGMPATTRQVAVNQGNRRT